MRIQLLDPEASHLVGFAKKKLRQLKELREKTGQAIWTKNITVGDFQIYLETANWGDKVRIEGGCPIPDLVIVVINWEDEAVPIAVYGVNLKDEELFLMGKLGKAAFQRKDYLGVPQRLWFSGLPDGISGRDLVAPPTFRALGVKPAMNGGCSVLAGRFRYQAPAFGLYGFYPSAEATAIRCKPKKRWSWMMPPGYSTGRSFYQPHEAYGPQPYSYDFTYAPSTRDTLINGQNIQFSLSDNLTLERRDEGDGKVWPVCEMFYRTVGGRWQLAYDFMDSTGGCVLFGGASFTGSALGPVNFAENITIANDTHLSFTTQHSAGQLGFWSLKRTWDAELEEYSAWSLRYETGWTPTRVSGGALQNIDTMDLIPPYYDGRYIIGGKAKDDNGDYFGLCEYQRYADVMMDGSKREVRIPPYFTYAFSPSTGSLIDFQWWADFEFVTHAPFLSDRFLFSSREALDLHPLDISTGTDFWIYQGKVYFYCKVRTYIDPDTPAGGGYYGNQDGLSYNALFVQDFADITGTTRVKLYESCLGMDITLSLPDALKEQLQELKDRELIKWGVEAKSYYVTETLNRSANGRLLYFYKESCSSKITQANHHFAWDLQTNTIHFIEDIEDFTATVTVAAGSASAIQPVRV